MFILIDPFVSRGGMHSLILTVLFWKAEYASDELPRTAIPVIIL